MSEARQEVLHQAHVLNQMTMVIQKYLGKYGYRLDFDLSFVPPQIAKEMVVELRAYLTSKEHEVEERQTMDVPADWWEALRERWFPHWWLRRYPLRMRTIETLKKTRVVNVCPHIASGKRHVNFLIQSPDENEVEERSELFRLRRFVQMIALGYESDNAGYLGHECSMRVILEAKRVLGVDERS